VPASWYKRTRTRVGYTKGARTHIDSPSPDGDNSAITGTHPYSWTLYRTTRRYTGTSRDRLAHIGLGCNRFATPFSH